MIVCGPAGANPRFPGELVRDAFAGLTGGMAGNMAGEGEAMREGEDHVPRHERKSRHVRYTTGIRMMPIPTIVSIDVAAAEPNSFVS